MYAFAGQQVTIELLGKGGLNWVNRHSIIQALWTLGLPALLLSIGTKASIGT
jgi:hypothetical protein